MRIFKIILFWKYYLYLITQVWMFKVLILHILTGILEIFSLLSMYYLNLQTISNKLVEAIKNILSNIIFNVKRAEKEFKDSV